MKWSKLARIFPENLSFRENQVRTVAQTGCPTTTFDKISNASEASLVRAQLGMYTFDSYSRTVYLPMRQLMLNIWIIQPQKDAPQRHLNQGVR